MRRSILTLAVIGAALAAAPAGAAARSRPEQHHGRHHARVHHARAHHRIRHRTFGPIAGTGSTPTSSDTAGTIQSFDGGLLTISLNNGSTVSGMVDDNTEIECQSMDVSSRSHDDGDGGSGPDNSGPGGGDDQGRGDDNGGGDDDHGQGDDNEAGSCTAAALVAGATVRSAELRISSSGASWEKVELVG